jgi:hypothetical protein
MNAATVVSNLVALGVQVKDAWVKSGQEFGPFLTSGDFGAIEKRVDALLDTLKPKDLNDALRAIRDKETSFLRGRDIMALSVDELAQFSALSDVEHQLANRLLKLPPTRNDFLTVLVRDVLPVLATAAKIVVPILL